MSPWIDRRISQRNQLSFQDGSNWESEDHRHRNFIGHDQDSRVGRGDPIRVAVVHTHLHRRERLGTVVDPQRIQLTPSERHRRPAVGNQALRLITERAVAVDVPGVGQRICRPSRIARRRRQYQRLRLYEITVRRWHEITDITCPFRNRVLRAIQRHCRRDIIDHECLCQFSDQGSLPRRSQVFVFHTHRYAECAIVGEELSHRRTAGRRMSVEGSVVIEVPFVRNRVQHSRECAGDDLESA